MAQARAIPTVALPGEVAMPLVGLGSWQLRGRRAYDAVSFALEVGYRHVDTATVYGNEAEVGRALRGSGLPRQDVFLTTKLPPGSTGRERETLAASLRALGTDYVDLWLVHWPPGDRARPQTWRELLAIRDQGLARAVGVSNYSTSQLDRKSTRLNSSLVEISYAVFCLKKKKTNLLVFVQLKHIKSMPTDNYT